MMSFHPDLQLFYREWSEYPSPTPSHRHLSLQPSLGLYHLEGNTVFLKVLTGPSLSVSPTWPVHSPLLITPARDSWSPIAAGSFKQQCWANHTCFHGNFKYGTHKEKFSLMAGTWAGSHRIGTDGPYWVVQRKKEQRKLDRRRERRTQLMQEERQRRRECMRQGSEREEDNKKVRGKEMERQGQGDREL